MADKLDVTDPDVLSRTLFILTLAGAALFIGAVVLFIL